MILEGRIALVTGAGRGIGRAVALALAQEGADVVVNDVSKDAADKIAREVEGLGRRALAVPADISKSDEVAAMVNKTVNASGRLDILVNNAGIAKPSSVLKISDAEWDKHININLRGTFLCCREAGKQMVKQQGGKIINMASGVGRAGVPGMAAYTASKAGVLNLTRTLAVEWARFNINVNSVSPGTTMTEAMQETIADHTEYMQRRIARIPLKRWNTPADVARVVVFLAGPDANNITGEDIAIDGGSNALHSGFDLPV